MDYIKYKLVDGYEDYVIFRNGKLYSNKTKKFLKKNLSNTGYYFYDLHDGKSNAKRVRIHKLLALAFIPNPNNLPTRDHIDINPLNNNLSNLRWASYNLQIINQKLSSKNTTGFRGIKRRTDYDAYQASIHLNKKEQSKSFSFKKYGEDEALRLAIEWRKQMEHQHYKNII